MKKMLAVTVLTVAAAGAALAAEGTVYGKGVTVQDATPIATILADPGAFVGTTVRVEGTVTGVCKMRGCWMQVTDPETGDGVRVKVEDGVIVFPPETMGRRAAAEGVWEVVAVSGEHAAKEADGKACAEGEQHDRQAKVTYQLRGTGAIVY